jgi:hypothetical protein
MRPHFPVNVHSRKTHPHQCPVKVAQPIQSGYGRDAHRVRPLRDPMTL